MNPNLNDQIRPSNMEAMSLCDGFAQMSAAVIETWGEPPPEEATTLGDQCHAAIACELRGQVGEALPTKYDERCVGRCLTLADELIEENDIQPEGVFVEEKLDNCGLGVQRGGTIDLGLVGKDVVIVIDWKFGYLETTDADDNDQLLTYAVMAAFRWGKSRVVVVLFNPRLGPAGLTTAEYDGAALAAGAAWIREVTARQRRPNPTLSPSYLACYHCRALTRCPAAWSYIMDLQTALADIEGSNDPKTRGQHCARVLLALKMGENGKAIAKEYLNGGGVALGFTLTKGRRMTKIDSPKAIALATEAGRLPDLLEHAKFGSAAVDAMDGIIESAVSVEFSEGSIKADKSVLKEHGL